MEKKSCNLLLNVRVISIDVNANLFVIFYFTGINYYMNFLLVLQYINVYNKELFNYDPNNTL